MTALLELDRAERTYPDVRPVRAMRPTSLRVRPGDYVTVTGPSGSGKSTLLNVLGLLDEPTGGSYRINGVELVGAPEVVRGAVRGQRFGFVFQSFHLLAGRTAQENVELGMLYGPHPRRYRRELARGALERMGLAGRAHADPRQLSGGERQRVAIARAVAAEPSVLFCDEPTGNLDSANTAAVLAMLGELNRTGLTVVVVTHDEAVARDGRRRLTVFDGVVTEQVGRAPGTPVGTALRHDREA